jgi:nitronate monooxygenase
MGLRVPIVNAPMGGVAGGRLAAAVTAAGGLGMVGMGTAGSTSALHAELPHVRGTFGIGLVDWVIRKEPELLDAALAAQPVLVSVSFGTDLSWVSRVHDAGIAAATQVYNSVEAQRAQDAGIDLLVARGSEGGGHGDATIGTLPLLDAVLDAVSVPVLAAGGIASPRSLAAVLAAGASGAWLGTVLSASPEALTSDASRRALVAARETDTPDALDELAAAVAADDRRTAPVDAGQGVGMVTGVAPVAQVIERLCEGAEKLLQNWR